MSGVGFGFARLAATHYGVVLILFVSAYGLGRRILRRLNFANGYEDVAMSAGLGLGLFAQAVFLLGLVRLIYPATIVILLLTGIALGWRDLLDAGKRFSAAVRSSSWLARSVATIVVLLVVYVAVLPLYPPHLWDALSYHLPSARIYAETHAVRPTPYLRYCVFAQFNEMLFTLVMTFSDAISAQAVEFLMLILTAITIAGAASRVSRLAIVPAVVAWIGIPEVLVLGSQAYIDVGLALYVTLSIVAAWNWRTDRSWQWFVLAAAFIGFAISTKYTALVVLGCLGIALCVSAIRERRLRPLLIFTCIVALVAGPWFGYIYYYTGNPVFPFASKIFGTGCWNDRDVDFVNKVLEFGTGRSVKSFLLLSWNLAFHRSKFHAEAPLSPFLYLGIPLWVVGGMASPKTRFPALMTAAFLLFWFLAAQEPRYLFPVLPIICLLFGHAAAWISHWSGPMSLIILGIVSVFMAKPGFDFTGERLRVFDLPPHTSEETENFFRRFQTYDCYRWLNQHYGDHYVVYAFDPPYMSYFADGTRIGDILGAGRLQDVPTSSGSGLKSALRRFNAQFVLFSNEPDLTYAVPPDDDFFHSYFLPVATCSAGTVWRISATPFKEEKSEERISNGGFEDRERGWTIGPQVTFDSSVSHSGKVAARVEPGSIPLAERISVAPNRNYEMTFFSRAAGNAAKIRFVVVWFDKKNQDVRADVTLQPASPQWRRNSLLLIAPADASFATIYPESVDGPLWYDDISMHELTYVSQSVSSVPATRAAAAFGVYRPKERRLFIRHEISEGFADEVIAAPADGLPVAGDWLGDRHIEPGIYDPATGIFHLLGRKPKNISMPAEELPIAGDWNGKGMTTVGVYDPRTSRFELASQGSTQRKAITFTFGQPGDLPVSGDWNGDGVTTIGVYRPATATFYLRNKNTAGPPDQVIRYGTGKEIPVAGDWNSNGSASPGLFDPELAVFRLLKKDGSEMTIPYGIRGDRPFAATTRH